MTSEAPLEQMRSLTRTPRVSVITIFLNAEAYLEQAVDSVLAQEQVELELLLVDDGSGPQCSSMARAYADRFPGRVRYLEHPGHLNRGMSASRNLGLAQARGEFVAFIDADDTWEPHKLREQLAIMEAHPQLAMVCGAVRYWRSWQGGQDVVVVTGHVTNRVVAAPEAILALYPLGKAPAPCPSDLLLRRSIVEQLGGFETHFTGARQLYEDQAFLAKLYLAGPIYFSDRVWLNYRQHASSCVAEVKRSGKYADVRLYFLNWLQRYLNTLGEADPRVHAARERALFPYRHPICSAVARGALSIGKRARRLGARLLDGFRVEGAR